MLTADFQTYSSVGEMVTRHRTEALQLTSAGQTASHSHTTLNCWPQ